MGNLEGIIKDEIIRLARREMRKSFVPLRRDVWSMKGIVSQLRKSVLILQRFKSQQEKQMAQKPAPEVTPEEIKKTRFSPRLIKTLRKHLGLNQREMAALAGVTVGAVFQWEKGTFEPKDEKKKILLGLRKLGRREARSLLEERMAQPRPEEKVGAARKKSRRKASKK
jgi:DNA-binding transcriptional regulator YiaG